MKKSLLTIAIMLLTVAAQAQIKVHDDGQISLASLTKNYGLQVCQNGYTYLRTQYNTDYSWANMTMGNAAHQMHWIVQNKYSTEEDCRDLFMFFVRSNGHVYSTGSYALNRPSDCINGSNSKRSVGSEEALSVILGITADYYDEDDTTTPEEIENNEYINAEAVEGMINDLGKHTVGLSAENLQEVFPDAVRTDPQARLFINYNAVVAMLTQAVKEQQTQIELLRKTLEDNGLLEPEKP